MHSIIICEDNEEQLAYLSMLVQNYIQFHENQFRLVYEGTDPQTTLNYIQQEAIKKGLYLIDINLGADMTGVDLAEAIRDSDIQSKIIFITSEEDQATNILNRHIEPLAYISKNEGLETMQSNLHRALDDAYSRFSEITVRTKDVFSFNFDTLTYQFDLDEVISIEVSGDHRLTLKTITGQYDFFNTLAQIEQDYPTLLRIGRSDMINPVNIKHIDYKRRNVTMINDEQFTIATSRILQLRQLYKS